MSDLEKIPSEYSEGDLGVEITDLEAPESPDTPSKSRSSTSSPLPTSFLHWRGFLKRKPVQLAGASAFILLGLVILLSLSGTLSFLIEQRTYTPPTSHLPATVSIPSFLSTIPVPQQDGLTCLMDATWSPDSKRLAVLGYSQDCPQGSRSYQLGLVNVYDAHSVKLLVQVRPDGAILSMLRKQFSGAREKPVIIYDSVLWSPDGRQMALTFIAHFWPDQAAPIFAGMLLMRENGRQTVFLRQELEQELEESYLVWDLERGVPAVVNYGYRPNPSPFFTVNIPPALTYHWGTNGMLVPEISSASAGLSASLLGPVGNPDGDASFTLWQPGSAGRTIELGNGPVHFPGVYTWNTFFMA